MKSPQFIYLFTLTIYLFIYFWLRWVFVAVHGLSLVAPSGGYSSLQCGGFSCCRVWALGARASVVVAHDLQYLWLAGSRAQAQ